MNVTHTYDQFRRVLQKVGFTLLRSRKHETWVRILPDGTIKRIRISHQHGKDIPKSVFAEMLRQAGLTREEFDKLLRDC